MEITVHNRNVRISPRKARPVLYGLRGQNAQTAQTKLAFVNRKAAPYIRNLIKSGLSIAKENYLEVEQVTIKEIFCNQAPSLKRAMAWSKGQSRRITKRATHFTLVLESAVDAPEKKVKKPETVDKEAEKPAAKKAAKTKAEK